MRSTDVYGQEAMPCLTTCRQMFHGYEYAVAQCHDSALAMQHVLQSMYITLEV